MNKVLFPAFKYYAFDYVYENIMRQNLEFSWMFIPFPKGFQNNEDYCHSGIFANDNYRRPWTRSSVIPMCKVHASGSVLDEWKSFKYFDDFLEKLSASSYHNVTDFIPSSNPCSQIDLEEFLSLTEKATVEKELIHKECWKTDVVRDKLTEDFLLQDEVVFFDNLEKFGQHLPRLATFLSRLKTFLVQDPLVDCHLNSSKADILFRMEMPEVKEPEPSVFKEEFNVLHLTPEEHLILPYQLEVKANSSISYLLELNAMLELKPEIITYEGQTAIEGFITKSTEKIENFQHYITKKECYPAEYDIILDKACYSPCDQIKMETPMTPSCSPFKSQAETLHIELAEEEMSPAPQIFLITESAKESLEIRMCYADTYPALLKVPDIRNTFQHGTLPELKEKLSIYPETPDDVTVGCIWWTDLELTTMSSHTIETLPTNNSFHTEILKSSTWESFVKITVAQLEGLLKEKAVFMKQRTIVQKSDIQPNSHCNLSPKIKLSSSPLQSESNMASSHSLDNVKNSELITDGTLKDKVDARPSCSMEKFRKNLSQSTKLVSPNHVNTFSTQHSSSYHARKSNDTGHYSCEIQSKTTSDLLSNFIILRTRPIPNQSENKVIEECQVKESVIPETKLSGLKVEAPLSADVTSEERAQEDPDYHLLSVNIPASDSQCQAFCILKATATPILNKLIALGVPANIGWEFASVSFDSTRFFLQQQEKKVSDSCKIGKKDDKEIMLFKHAALFHILVTLRDLILMCTFDTALGFLCKAKEMYKSALGCCLDNVCKMLGIVQFVRGKKPEVEPKLTALQDQLSQWIERNRLQDKQLKALIVVRTDSDNVKSRIIDALVKMKDIKATGLDPGNGRCLEKQTVLDSLESCSCIIINNQHIGNDFPWAHFSLVIEYNSTDCWLKLCQDLKIPHMTLKICLPEYILSGESARSLLLAVEVPYIFISSEGLLNSPEIMQLMESRYNITFIERISSASLQQFGKTDQFAVITVDECTAIILQNVDELKYEKSSENIILKLVALSLQYSCCWIVLYCNTRINSEYCLSGNILHNLSLIYAALIPLTSKSKELEVKVLISPGVEETGLLIRKIADHTVLSSNSDVYKWLDKSWLSVLSSEAEQCLLAFPCINPLVAQLMLHRASSLQWLLSATNDQLQELLPEVPLKVLKHFSDITLLYRLRSSASSPRDSYVSPSIRTDSSFNPFNEQTLIQKSLCAIDGRKNHNNSPWHIDKLQPNTEIMPRDLPPLNTSGVMYSDDSFRPLLSYQGETSQLKTHPLFSQKHTFLGNPRGRNEFGQRLESMPFLKESHKPVSEPSLPPVSFGFSTKAASLDVLRPNTIQSENIFGQYDHSAQYLENISGPIYRNNENSFFTDDYFKPLDVCNITGENTNSEYQRSTFFTEFLSNQAPKAQAYYKSDLEDNIYISPTKSTEKQWDFYSSQQRSDGFSSIPIKKGSHDATDGLHFLHMTEDLAGKKIISAVDTGLAEEETSKGIAFSQPPQLKRRKLSYEKVPGRCDGQTRLKFF